MSVKSICWLNAKCELTTIHITRVLYVRYLSSTLGVQISVFISAIPFVHRMHTDDGGGLAIVATQHSTTYILKYLYYMSITSTSKPQMNLTASEKSMDRKFR